MLNYVIFTESTGHILELEYNSLTNLQLYKYKYKILNKIYMQTKFILILLEHISIKILEKEKSLFVKS